MRLIIHIADEGVRVVLGGGLHRLRIKDARWFGLPPGTVVDGSVLEEGPLMEALCRIGGDYPRLKNHVVLVPGGGRICQKIVESHSHAAAARKRDAFRQLKLICPSGKELVWDDRRIKDRPGRRSGTGRFLYTAMEVEEVSGLVRLAQRCGLRVRGVLPSLAALAEAGGRVVGQRTCIVAMAEAGWLITLLYEKGCLKFAGRECLESPRKTEGFGREVSSVLRLAAYYHSSLEGADWLEGVCLLGMYPEEEAWLADILTLLGRCHPMPAARAGIHLSKGLRLKLEDYLPAIGGLVGIRPFCPGMAVGRRVRTGRGVWRRMAVASLCLWAGFYLCLWLYGIWRTDWVRDQEREVREEIRRLEADMEWREQEGIRERLTRLESYRREEQALHDETERMDKLGGGLLDLLAELGDGEVRIDRVDYQDGVLTFVARTGDYHLIPNFVQRVEESGRFGVVDYTGFEAMPDEAEMRYRFEVSCRWGQ